MFLFPGGTLKLSLNNVIVINFVECVKLTFSGHPQTIIMQTFRRDIFHSFFGRLSTNFMQIQKVIFKLSVNIYYISICLHISICLPIANIEKIMI